MAEEPGSPKDVLRKLREHDAKQPAPPKGFLNRLKWANKASSEAPSLLDLLPGVVVNGFFALLIMAWAGFGRLFRVGDTDFALFMRGRPEICILIGVVLIASSWRFHIKPESKISYRITVWLGNIHWLLLATYVVILVYFPGPLAAEFVFRDQVSTSEFNNIPPQIISELGKAVQINWFMLGGLIVSAFFTFCMILGTVGRKREYRQTLDRL